MRTTRLDEEILRKYLEKLWGMKSEEGVVLPEKPEIGEKKVVINLQEAEKIRSAFC